VMPAALDVYVSHAVGDTAALDAALARVIDDPQTAPFAVRCFAAAAPADWDRLADALAAVVSDTSEPLHRRFGAWVALVEGGRDSHASAPGLQSRADRTAPVLRQAIDDPGAEPEAVNRVRRHPLSPRS
jgi:hypothetical protein